MITSASVVQSQYYFYNDKYYNSLTLAEAGFSIGGMNCLTDLGGRKGNGKPFLKDINWKNTHPAGGSYFGLLYDQTFGIRAEVQFGKISASDNILKDDQSSAKNRYNRNLHFKSNITEVLLLAEFFPLALFNREHTPFISPFLLSGIGIFRFNPQAQLNNQWIDLHPLHTEGQGFKEYPGKTPYKITQVNFPVGFGLRYEISALINARLEMVYRFLRTDYLDDVSTQYIDPSMFYTNLSVREAGIAKNLADRSAELQPGISRHEGEIRGNPENRDTYFSCNLKVGLILNRKAR